MLSEDVAAFLQSGVAIMVATRDGKLVPDLVRGFGAVVDPDRATVTLYLPDAVNARALGNLKADPRIAAVFCRPRDYQTYQIKGRCIGTRPAGSVDRELQRRYCEEFFQAVREVGLAHPERWRYSPSTAVELRVEEVFDQTPGPHAGTRR